MNKSGIRKTVVAGTFYSANPEILESEVSKMIVNNSKKINSTVLISPHAGYVYSGNCAGKGYGSIVIPERVIILGLDHSGSGYPYAIDAHCDWQMPFGTVSIDDELRTLLDKESNIFKIDKTAGLNEHSIEVQIPFLQYLNPDVKILPIYISGYNYYEHEICGNELANLIKKIDEDILIVASTDMSHYVSADFAKEKDSLAIKEIENLNPKGLLDTVMSERISMCGVLPVTLSLITAKNLGADKTKIINYTNSGEVSGDFEQVVAYLSMAVYK
jgi:AmmeMemoRadiSam system protein B